MVLALFDLDHTLIPFDSAMAWTRWLIARGVLPPAAEGRYLAACQHYVEGTLDIRALHRAALQPLAAYGLTTLRQWGHEFEASVRELVPATTLALVRGHREAGDLCAIVTATTRILAEPFARLFDIEHLVATEAALVPGTGHEAFGSHLSGEIEGEPCTGAYKPAHVARWLASLGLALGDFEHSVFYSDSVGDLPLFEAVDEPVAVHPDLKLRALAQARGWRIVEPWARG